MQPLTADPRRVGLSAVDPLQLEPQQRVQVASGVKRL
jgi:hypothetical protein